MSMDAKIFERLDAVLSDLTGAEAQEVVLGLLTRAGAAALRLNAHDDILLEPGEACAIAKIRRRTLTSWARAKKAASWAVWVSPRCLRIREMAFRRAVDERHRALTSAKAQRASARRRKRAAEE